MINAAHSSLSRHAKGSEARVRVFRLALKTSRFCLDKDALDAALKVLESCSEYASAEEQGSPVVRMADDDTDDQRKVLQRHAVQYWLLRTMLASKNDRPDIAQHFYSKVDQTVLMGSADLMETAAEICYESGTHLLSRQRNDAGKQWLERANALLNTNDMDDPGHDCEDLRMDIVATLVEILVKGSDESDLGYAWNLAKDLGEKHGLGDRLAVLNMQLAIALQSDGTEGRVVPILSRMVKTIVLTEDTFRM